MARKKILFISHQKTQCGVYEFGKNITDVLCDSQRYDFIRVECSSLAELQAAIELNQPVAIIYNYMPELLPWAATKIIPRFYRNNLATIKVPQIGIIHEVTQGVADRATDYRNKYFFGTYTKLLNSLFDYYIAADPTLLLKNPVVYKTGRLVKHYQNNFSEPKMPIIGSFGFATAKKGFEKIVQLVQRDFDQAIIRLNVPVADFGDQDGVNAKTVEDNCRRLLVKPGIELNITHDFLDTKGLLDFLAQNTINVFLYEDTTARGISSVTDNALSVYRPIAISDSLMFRHMLGAQPSICVNDNDLSTIIKNGFSPLDKYHDEWCPANLIWDYERIIDSVLARKDNQTRTEKNVLRRLWTAVHRILSLPTPSFTWLRNLEVINSDQPSVGPLMKYVPLILPDGASLNRILDNTARNLYSPTIKKLEELAPQTMAQKIPAANVQQAFVFDTVSRYLDAYNNPKLLCVGSYEDTASLSLQKTGIIVEEIDPTQNYSVQEYATKPSVVKNSYDIIFSTSVIEHDPDDASFMRAIDDLLAPGGVLIITCDYKEDWRPGEDKPEVDARFYTKHDLEQRLLSYLTDCQLVDRPQWDCPHPDFNFLGKYQYTFATLVAKKKI